MYNPSGKQQYHLASAGRQIVKPLNNDDYILDALKVLEQSNKGEDYAYIPQMSSGNNGNNYQSNIGSLTRQEKAFKSQLDTLAMLNDGFKGGDNVNKGASSYAAMNGKIGEYLERAQSLKQQHNSVQQMNAYNSLRNQEIKTNYRDQQRLMRDELDKRHFMPYDRETGKPMPSNEKQRLTRNFNSMDVNTFENSDEDPEGETSNQNTSSMQNSKPTAQFNLRSNQRMDTDSSTLSNFRRKERELEEALIRLKMEEDQRMMLKPVQEALNNQTEMISKLVTKMGTQKDSKNNESNDLALKLKLAEMERNNNSKSEFEGLKQQLLMQQVLNSKERRRERIQQTAQYPPIPVLQQQNQLTQTMMMMFMMNNMNKTPSMGYPSMDMGMQSYMMPGMMPPPPMMGDPFMYAPKKKKKKPKPKSEVENLLMRMIKEEENKEKVEKLVKVKEIEKQKVEEEKKKEEHEVKLEKANKARMLLNQLKSPLNTSSPVIKLKPVDEDENIAKVDGFTNYEKMLLKRRLRVYFRVAMWATLFIKMTKKSFDIKRTLALDSDKLFLLLKSISQWTKKGIDRGLIALIENQKENMKVVLDEKEKPLKDIELDKRVNLITLLIKIILENLLEFTTMENLNHEFFHELSRISLVNSFLPTKFMFLYELNRMTFSETEGFMNLVSQKQSQLIIGFFILIRIILVDIILQPWLHSTKIKRRQGFVENNRITLASVFYDLFWAAIPDTSFPSSNWSELGGKMKIDPFERIIDTSENDFEFISYFKETGIASPVTNENEIIAGLYPSERIQLIYRSRPEWKGKMVGIIQKFLHRVEYYLRKTYAEKPFQLENPSAEEEKEDIMKLQYNAANQDLNEGLSPLKKPVEFKE